MDSWYHQKYRKWAFSQGQLLSHIDGMSYRPITDRSRVRRGRPRAQYDEAAVHGVLDAGDICHVAYCIEQQPYLLPTAYARSGDRVFLHGAVANRMLGQLAKGIEAVVTVTLVDGYVLARSQFHHSMNYRCAVLFGRAIPVTDPVEKHRALRAIVEHMVPGRAAHSRPPHEKELRITQVLEFEIDEASVKVRQGDPRDDAEDLELFHWAGVIPTHRGAHDAVPSADLSRAIKTPEHIKRASTG